MIMQIEIWKDTHLHTHTPRSAIWIHPNVYPFTIGRYLTTCVVPIPTCMIAYIVHYKQMWVKSCCSLCEQSADVGYYLRHLGDLPEIDIELTCY